jgi:hypothetical protein
MTASVVRVRRVSLFIVCSTVLSSKFLLLSISQAQIRFSKLSSFRGGTNRGHQSRCARGACATSPGLRNGQGEWKDRMVSGVGGT